MHTACIVIQEQKIMNAITVMSYARAHTMNSPVQDTTNTTQTASIKCIGLESGMCASHLKLNCTFTRYRILICRGRSEKGQGISERWDCIVRKGGR